MSNLILDAALDYAARGWRVVPNCPKKKKPWLEAWQKKASSDEQQIREWWNEQPNSNVGVKLGPDSDVIDVECDSPAAAEALVKLFSEGFPKTPTWGSKRGPHRLFRYRPDLPKPESNSFKLFGIEFRTGNGGKGAQSVFPPSVHPSGARYEWMISPSESEVAAIPEYVWAKLWNCEGEETTQGLDPVERARRYIAKIPGIGKGSRNPSAYEVACHLFDFLESERDVWPLLRHWNLRNSPPLDHRELQDVMTNAAKYRESPRGYKLHETNGQGHAPASPELVSPLHQKAGGHSTIKVYPAWTTRGQTDIANAARFVARFGDDVRYCAQP